MKDYTCIIIIITITDTILIKHEHSVPILHIFLNNFIYYCIFIKFIFNLLSYERIHMFSVGFPSKIQHAFLVSLIRATKRPPYIFIFIIAIIIIISVIFVHGLGLVTFSDPE
jgi:hypothetical protein